MAHHPVNHPARPIYRAIGGLAGLYMVIFGVLGVLEAGGADFFTRDDTLLLGQGTNLGHSVITAAIGAIVLIATGLGRNVDAFVNTWIGYALIALGLAELAVLRTDANYLNATVATCIVTMLLGLLLLVAGMYGRVGSDDEARAAHEARLLL